MDFPMEIWMLVLDTLGQAGQLRDYTNLCRALYIDPKRGHQYRKKALLRERCISKLDYTKQIIDFWETTGIDDGVPNEYLKANLNKSTQMYRTIWSSDTLYNRETDTFVLCTNPIDNFTSHNDNLHLTYTVYRDTRNIKFKIGGRLNNESIQKWIYNLPSKKMKKITK